MKCVDVVRIAYLATLAFGVTSVSPLSNWLSSRPLSVQIWRNRVQYTTVWLPRDW
jgi:hypothetical protein